MTLTRIGVLSLARFFACLYGLLGLIVGAIFSLISLFGAAARGPQPGAAFIGIGVGAIVILPLFYGVLGFIGGIIGAALFNLVASMIGGVELEFSPGSRWSADPLDRPERPLRHDFKNEDPFRSPLEE